MEKGLALMILVIILVVFFLITPKGHNQELQKTTYAGQPAYGLVQNDGWYSFYATSDRTTLICTLPQGEAIALH